jgi:hypothetical protein
MLDDRAAAVLGDEDVEALVGRFGRLVITGHHAHGLFQEINARGRHVEGRQGGRLRLDDGAHGGELKRIDAGEGGQVIGQARPDIDARPGLDGEVALRLERDLGLADGHARHAQPFSQFALAGQTAACRKLSRLDEFDDLPCDELIPPIHAHLAPLLPFIRIIIKTTEILAFRVVPRQRRHQR